MNGEIKRIVSYYARPASFSTGGVNSSLQEWMRAFAQQGYAVKVISARGGFEHDVDDASTVSSISIPHFGKKRSTMIPKDLHKQLRKGDLVYLHEGWTLSNLVAAAICRLRGIDYVVMAHGVYTPSILSSLRFVKLRKILESRLLAGTRAVHLFFDSEVEELKMVSPAAKPVVAVTGLDVPAIHWRPDIQRPYLAWIGRYDIEHKGIDLLFQALAEIPETDRPVVRMHGPDHRGDKNRVEELLHHHGLGKSVTVGSNLASTDVLSFLASSQGFVHVPRWEALGLTIVEALSVGCPVVLSDKAHIAADLRTASAAHIVKGDNIASISDGILKLWNGKTQTGQQGRKWVEDTLAWPKVVRRLTSLLSPKESALK